jgi:hypothetical protein
MPETLPFSLTIDREHKRLAIAVKRADGTDSEVNMTLDDLTNFMAVLSHYQHVLAHSLRGHEIEPPMDLATAFVLVGGHFALAADEGLPRLAVADDPTTGEVVMMLQGSSGRITGYRILPETARKLSNDLLKCAVAAEELPAE